MHTSSQRNKSPERMSPAEVAQAVRSLAQNPDGSYSYAVSDEDAEDMVRGIMPRRAIKGSSPDNDLDAELFRFVIARLGDPHGMRSFNAFVYGCRKSDEFRKAISEWRRCCQDG